MELCELEAKLECFDKKKIADEIVWWIVENVPNFIDTQRTSYSLSFLAHEEKMPEMAQLEMLCREIDKIEIEVSGEMDQMSDLVENDPEIAKAAEMQQAIIDFMEDVREIMTGEEDEDNEYKTRIKKSFSFYQDFVGVNIETGEEITKDMDGYVSFEYLSFENVDMTVTATAMVPVLDSDGRLVDYKRDESQSKVMEMPSSFCIDFKIQLWENKGATSLF